MKVFYTLLLLLCLLLTVASPATAQSNEQWFFAWDNESGALVGYTVTGNIVPLLTIDPDFPSQAWRIAPDQALALVSTGGGVGLYRLTPSGATAIAPQLGTETILSQISYLAAYRDPYAVLIASDGAYSTGLLVNLTAGTIEPLTGESYALLNTWKFSADGTTLRYISRPDREATTWSIWERELASGNELGIYTFESPFPAIQTTPDGEQWLLSELAEGPRRQVYTAINADGSTRVVDEIALDDPSQPLAVYSLLGNSQLSFAAPCSTDCTYTQLDLAGNPIATYAVANIPSAAVLPLGGIDAAHVLVLADNIFWRLDAAQAGQNVGRYDALQLLSLSSALQSPDGRWLVSSDGVGGIQLWDLVSGQAVFQRAAMGGVTVRYSEAGIIISAAVAPQSAVLYRYADSQLVELPASPNGFFMEALNDGTLLYTQGAEGEGRPAGIFRYNPADGAYILVGLNVFPLLVR